MGCPFFMGVKALLKIALVFADWYLLYRDKHAMTLL